jgi:hypothetical protein
LRSKEETFSRYKHTLDERETKDYKVFSDPKILSNMFLPKNIPEDLEDDAILKELLKVKTVEVSNLMDKISTAKTMPMLEVKEYLAKIAH